MPLGRYRITISKGTTWMGPSKLFGLSGESRETVDPIEFYQRGDTNVGIQIELETLGGNLDTQPALSR